jgi:hypothetical protein
MRTPFDPGPLDPAPELRDRVETQDTAPQPEVAAPQPEAAAPQPEVAASQPEAAAPQFEAPTPEATLAAVEAAMLVVDAAGIVDVGVRSQAAAHDSVETEAIGAATTASEAAGVPVLAQADRAADHAADHGPRTGRIAPRTVGRTLVKVAQFAATAAALMFLAFGGRLSDIVTAAKSYYPKTRLAAMVRDRSVDARSSKPQAIQATQKTTSAPRAAQSAAPAVHRAAAPAPAQVSAPRPQAAVSATPRVKPKAATRTTAATSPRRQPAAAGAGSAEDAAATAQAPDSIREQKRQEYYLRLMTEGHRLYQLGWYGPAMGRFRQGAAVKPQSQNAHLWIARSAMRIGRYDVARSALERTIAISPNNDAAREARALLDQLKIVERERL